MFSKRFSFTLVLITLILVLSSCSSIRFIPYDSSKVKQEKIKQPDSIYIQKPKRVPTYYKGFKYPFIHKNGFKDYEIADSKLTLEKNEKVLKEIRYNNTYSAFYTRNSMYEIFGDWDVSIFFWI